MAWFAPTKICVAPGAVSNPLPVIVSAVPPAVGPLLGAMVVMAGGVGAAATRQMCPCWVGGAATTSEAEKSSPTIRSPFGRKPRLNGL